MAELRDQARGELLDAAEFGIVQLIAKLRDGKMSHDELEEALVDLASETIDAAIPTGPLEVLDDAVIRAGVVTVYRFAAKLLDRDPVNMRKRAARMRARGNEDRADELEQHAAVVAERQLVASTVGKGG
jgi:hypothetical protein